MKMIATMLFLGAAVTPVQKVIQMMEEMKAKGTAEMEAEQKTWEAYAEWCKDTTVEKEYSIKTATADIERLIATIQKHKADAATLADKINSLDQEIAGWNADLAKATELRTSEHADFEAMQQDYSESVDALGRAISVLKAKAHDVPQAKLLLQKVSKLAHVPAHAKSAIAAFLQKSARQSPSGYVQPEADAYEFQSGGVVEMLEKLLDKFRDELNTLEMDEKQAQHNYDMQALQLKDSIKFAEKEREEKQAEKSAHDEAAAQAKGDLAQTQAAKAADEKYLADLTAQCDLKKASFEQRQELRKGELEALTQAIEIISGESVSGAADTYLPALVQNKHSLAMFRARSEKQVEKMTRVAELLRTRGHDLGSHALSLLALRVSQDPFEKVINMIKDLITRLQEEAAEEASHKAWCDEELKTNKLTREEKTQEVDTLTATAETLSAEIAKLGEEISALAAAVAELDRALAEATEIRTKEKAKNEETIADAKEAQEAVKMATKIIKEFYAKAATATALTQSKVRQSPGEDAPASWDEPYKGMGGSSKGVVGMLEVILSDFARLEADTTADEDAAAREFAEFSEDTIADKEAKVAESKGKVKTKTRKERELSVTQDDLKSAQAELDAALAYYDELKPACLEAGVSYAERAERRQQEIESLNEAYKILSGDA